MFSITTMASSTTNPVEMVSAISERLSMLKPARYITPKVPMQRHRNGDAGDERGPAVPQEDEHHQDHQCDRNQQGDLDILHRSADGDGLIHGHAQIDGARNGCLQLRQERRGSDRRCR